MNATDIINFAVPVFILLMVLEALVSWRRGWGFYKLNDTLINMSLGSTRQVVDIFTKVFLFAAYVAIYNWGHWLELSATSWWHWVLVALAVDFVYYWQHRWSHEINLLWAGHLVHHSSEEFNISVALRQSFVHDLMVYPLFFLLALLGLPPFEFFVGVAFLAIYQYWIHTRAIPRLPEWIEGIFNTPSAHRVHHGSNPQYLDKNYAGLFIFIDRLFGTYQAEKDPVRYGLTVPVKTWNPMWANVHYFVELFHTSTQAQGWRNKLTVWFAHPGWLPTNLRAPVATEGPPKVEPKFQTRISKPLWRYALFQYALAATALMPIMAIHKQLPALGLFLLMAFATWTGCNVGGLQQARPWVWFSEHLKWVTAIGSACLYLSVNPSAAPLAISVMGIAVLSISWLRNIRNDIQLLPDTDPSCDY